MKTNNLRIAWAAGFIDGEGCISVQDCTARGASRRQFQGFVDVAQTKPAPLDELVRLLGGRVRPYREDFYWRLYGVSAAAAVRRILPYMIGKRQQAELLLEFTALKGTRGRRRSDATVARMAEICALFRVLNARRPRHAERLSEGAPRIAIVGSLPPRMMR